MKATISCWADLYSVLQEAGVLSDPATSEPVGTAEYTELGGKILKVSIQFDLVPRPDIAKQATIEF